MAGHDILIHGPDGDFSAYKTGEGPVLIVLQEIFGVNQVMRELCDEYAAQGFTAVCPDLFWRIEPGIQITDKTEEDWKKAFDLFGKFDVDKFYSRCEKSESAPPGHLDLENKLSIERDYFQSGTWPGWR